MLFDSLAMFVGGFGNMIILINCVLQAIREGLSPFILIAFTMCLNNSLLICFQVLNGLMCISAYLQPMSALFQGVLMAFLCYSLWSSSWLSLYYQFKIVPSSSTVNAWVIRNFNVLIPCFMLSSRVIFVAVGFSSMFNEAYHFSTNSFNISTVLRNQTTNHLSSQVLLYCTFATLSILITFMSVMKILTSLRRHVRNMTKNSEVTTSFKAHYTAAKSIITLLVFNLFLFLSQVVGYLRGDLSWISTLKSIALSVLLTVCPYILIAGNKKLKKSSKHVMHMLGINSLLAKCSA